MGTLGGRHGVRELTRARHKSIIAYLAANNLPSSADALRQELSLSEETFDVATTKKYETLLEKKWTSIVRLQKKVMMPYRSRVSTTDALLDP